MGLLSLSLSLSPAHELVALAAGPDGPVPTAVAPIPVDEHCWPVRGDRERARAEYLGRPVGLRYWDLAIDDWDALPGMTITTLLSYFDSADTRRPAAGGGAVRHRPGRRGGGRRTLGS